MDIGINIDENNRVIGAFPDSINGNIHLDVDESTFKDLFENAVPFKYINDSLEVDTDKQQIDSLSVQIADLQEQLDNRDSVDAVAHALEYKLRDESIPADLQQVLDDRQSWRDQIVILQEQMSSLN